MDKQVQIPYTYKWLAAGNKNLYVRYIKGYMNLYHPRLYPMKIIPRGENLPDIVICIKK